MNKLIIALALTIVSGTSFANGFSPWEDRTTVQDIVSVSGTIDTAPAGFAPWEERVNNAAFASEVGMAMEIEAGSIFRPWS